ncbi:hypothetical protein IWW45_009371, partial [Coemansia sp. RSA 485]
KMGIVQIVGAEAESSGQQCANQCNNSVRPDARYCSEQCEYVYTLEAYRKSVDLQPASYESSPEPLLLANQSAGIVQLGKLHTSTLIRCGIDPWSPAAEIHMRQQFAHVLISTFNGIWALSSNSECAWLIENMAYCLAYSPKFDGYWKTAEFPQLSTSLQ